MHITIYTVLSAAAIISIRAENRFVAVLTLFSSGGKNGVSSGVHSLTIVNSAQAHKINKAEVLELPQICLQYFSATHFD